MEQRRVELRMSWRDVTKAAEMSYEGLRAIRRGERHPTAVTKGRIEDALEWAAGSIDAVIAGGEPTPMRPGTPAPAPAEQASQSIDRAELEELRATLVAALERIDRIQRDAG